MIETGLPAKLPFVVCCFSLVLSCCLLVLKITWKFGWHSCFYRGRNVMLSKFLCLAALWNWTLVYVWRYYYLMVYAKQGCFFFHYFLASSMTVWAQFCFTCFSCDACVDAHQVRGYQSLAIKRVSANLYFLQNMAYIGILTVKWHTSLKPLDPFGTEQKQSSQIYK